MRLAQHCTRECGTRRWIDFLRARVEGWSESFFVSDHCKARAFYCEICRSNVAIFPFQHEFCVSCPHCKVAFHRHVLSPSGEGFVTGLLSSPLFSLCRLSKMPAKEKEKLG